MPSDGKAAGHMCQPTWLHRQQVGSSVASAHTAREGSQVACDCGKRWRVTKSHHGPGGRICGCGWACITPDPGPDADLSASFDPRRTAREATDG